MVSLVQNVSLIRAVKLSDEEQGVLLIAALIPSEFTKCSRTHHEAIDTVLITAYKGVLTYSTLETAHVALLQLQELLETVDPSEKFAGELGKERMIANIENAICIIVEAINLLRKQETVDKLAS